MFGASSADQEMGEFHSWNDSSSLVSGDKSNVAINHHRELHRILVRTLWRNIYPGNKPDALSKTPVKVHLEFVLQEQDIHTLSKYCDSNNDSANLISPDLINDIFSGIIRPVTLSDEPKLFHWLNDKPLFWISMLASFTLAIWLSILIYHSRHRLLMLVLSLLLVLIISQSMYKKYNTRLAQKMSVLSRYNGPPVDCKPPDQQPWSRFFTQYFTSRPKTDECLQYYEEVLSEPFFTTSIYEVCLELIYQPIISLCGSLGTAFGEFYNNVSAYIPWWLSPIILGYFIFLAFLFVVRAPKSLSNEQPLRSRRAKHKIKSSTVPPLTSS
uniref:Chloride channel CLIC-like protein 1 n=1 Tax=Trichobilharzia regenti TaxID=157069 RepID=A0AA85JMP8_TRIRE|nr:unnamed protein product [Trichobilharzia regenti]